MSDIAQQIANAALTAAEAMAETLGVELEAAFVSIETDAESPNSGTACCGPADSDEELTRFMISMLLASAEACAETIGFPLRIVDMPVNRG